MFVFFSKGFRMTYQKICLLKNLYVDQEATVRIGHGTTDWFQRGKEYIKAIDCSPAYLTYMQSRYNMWNAGLDDKQAGIKIARRNINIFVVCYKYSNDTTLKVKWKC